MSREELEPMDRELAAWLAVKKTTPEPSGAVRDRVLASVLAQTGTIAPSHGVATGGAAHRVVGAHPFASVLAALAAGVAVGAVAVAPRLARERIVYVDRVVVAPSVVTAPPVVPPVVRELPPNASAREPVVHAPPVKVDGAIDSQRLASERAVLDIARAALSRGEAAAAIDAAQRHAEEFPNGQLAEEREAILIRGLVQVGDVVEARARAAKFHARFPESIFGRTIDAAIGSIP